MKTLRDKVPLLLAIGTVLAWIVYLRLDWLCNRCVGITSYSPPYEALDRWRRPIWGLTITLSLICALVAGFTAVRTSADVETPATMQWSRWWVATSIVLQQLCFLALQAFEIMLIHVSAWVARAPVCLLWALYFLGPFVYVRPISASRVLRSYSKDGWLFVSAALVWIAFYVFLSNRYGVPVSWNEVRDEYLRGHRGP